MKYRFYIIIYLFLTFGLSVSYAQEEPIQDLKVIDSTSQKQVIINPLSPAKAAFYSAMLPGLGQAYNKKYWKIPIVYGAIGTSLYFFFDNNKKYNRYRDAYKRRLAGFNDDQYQYLDDSRLISAQKFYQKNRDLSALITAAFYILNILDANVDAHLMQYNVNDNLSVKPDIFKNDYNSRQTLGFKFTYEFK